MPNISLSAITVQYQIKRAVVIEGKTHDLGLVISLLIAIQQNQNLRSAAQIATVSYRRAWDELTRFEALLGAPLVIKQRGKGTRLGEMGQVLVDLAYTSDVEFASKLTDAADQATQLMQSRLYKGENLKIVASDSAKLSALRQLKLPLELSVDGSGAALEAYVARQCDMAGFHLIAGQIGLKQIQQYQRYLDAKKDVFLLLEQRKQGLISHPKRPVSSLQQVVRQQMLFVNRQKGAGTRFLFDSLLQSQGISAEQIQGYYHEEHTHLAVASLVNSRQADVCLGVKSVADKLDLEFQPLAQEYYFLVFRTGAPHLSPVLDALELTEPGMDYQQVKKIVAQEPS
jgi:molybdate transport repressor ModE-like protein